MTQAAIGICPKCGSTELMQSGSVIVCTHCRANVADIVSDTQKEQVNHLLGQCRSCIHTASMVQTKLLEQINNYEAACNYAGMALGIIKESTEALELYYTAAYALMKKLNQPKQMEACVLYARESGNVAVESRAAAVLSAHENEYKKTLRDTKQTFLVLLPLIVFGVAIWWFVANFILPALR